MLQSQASAACREKDLMDMEIVSHHNQSTVCYERAEVTARRDDKSAEHQ
jgi:hypothetical protein